jgi:hypothetical protein
MNPNPIPRVSLAFVRRTNAVLIAFSRNVVTQMTGNPNFTTPYPLLADVTTAIDALEVANEEAMDGSKQAILDRDAKKAMLLSLLRELAAYVQNQGKANKAIINSSGFHMTKVPAPYGPLPAPLHLQLGLTGKSGELELRMKRVLGVTAGYSVQTSEAAGGPYVDYVTSSKARILIGGLTPAKSYWVRARANGAAGPSGWSNPATAIAI